MSTKFLKIGLTSNGLLRATFVADGKESVAFEVEASKGEIIIKGDPVIDVNDSIQPYDVNQSKEMFLKIANAFSVTEQIES
jgi:hypothetical protein